MRLKLARLSFLLIIFSTSCSHLYEPALYHQDIAYQPKPASFDSVKTANYLSAGLNINPNTNLNDLLISGQLNFSQGYVFNNFNLAYGVFGVLGQYQSDEVDKNHASYFTDKFFGAGGGRLSANTFVTSGRTDFRFIGVEMAYSHEFGSYADFRQHLNTIPGFNVDPRTNLFTIGLTSEVYFHNRNNTDFQHGIRVFLGKTLGYDKLNTTFYYDQNENTIFPKVSYFIKIKNIIGSIEAGQGVFIRVGYKF